MSLRFFYRENTGDVIEVIDGIDWPDGFSVQHCAEEGRVGQGTITVRDPEGVYNFSGMRTCYLVEDSIPDSDDVIIWRGYVWTQHIKRDRSDRTGVSRTWQLDVVDQNSILARRFQIGSDAKRPQETDVHRVQWLVDTAEAGTFDDTTTYLHTDRPTSMNATDYNNQANLSVLDDCAQSSGKNYWADYFNDVAGIGIWYGHAGEPDYVASIAVSNVPGEADGDAIWAPGIDAQWNRDPSRVYSGVVVPYDGGQVYRTRAATATEFAARDTTMPAVNVKTASMASKRANRYLTECSTEEVRVTFTLVIASTHVNRAKAGQWINCHFSHLPGFQDAFTPVRILSRQISQLTPEWYQIDYEVSVGDVLPPPGNATARLYFPMNRDSGVDLNPEIVFDTTGDDPGLGRAYYPLAGDGLGYHVYSGPHDGDVWDGIEVLLDGTVDIVFTASFAAVVSTEVEAVFTVWVDGDVVGTTSFAEFHAGPGFFSRSGTVTVSGIDVTAGQIIHCSIETTGTFLGGYKSPAGVGGPDESLTVSGTFA